MPKRPAPEPLDESLQALPPVPKKARIDDGAPPRSSKRRAPDASEVDAQDELHRPIKRARRDDGPSEEADDPDSDSWPFEPTPSPEPEPQEDAATAAYWQEFERQVRAHIRRADDFMRQARKNYAARRRSRLLSPPLLADDSISIRSDADENGYFPAMFDLEDDDPEVEEVFGPEFAARLRARRSRPQPQDGPPRLPQSASFVPDKQAESHHGTGQLVSQPARSSHAGSTARSGRRRQNASQLPRRRSSRQIHTTRPQASAPQPCRKPARFLRANASATACLQSSRRLTRQDVRNKVFYELDHRGGARLIR